jgi:hypothetical protein
MQQAAEAIGGRVQEADPREAPRRLRWTDPQSGERLAVEVWADALADDLVALGFEEEAVREDETASSLFVVIRVRAQGAV